MELPVRLPPAEGRCKLGCVLRVASAWSQLPEGAAAAQEIARHLQAGLRGAQARAAVLFTSTAHGPGYGRFERTVRAATGAEHAIGCSASGVLSECGEAESGPGVSALAIAGDVEVRRFFLAPLRGRAEEVGREIGRAALAIEREPRSLLLLADSYNLAPDELLAGIAAVAPGVAVVGAGATEDGSVGETTVFGRGVEASNAVAGLALGGICLRTAVSESCAIWGSWRTVTRADGHRILELEERPALDVFLAALPRSFQSDVRQALRSTLAALAAPVSDSEIAPPFVLRPFVGADPRSGALLVGDEVLAGARVAIAVRDASRAREILDANLARLVARGSTVAGALYFNGFERGEALHGVPDLDTAYLRRRLASVPIAGFFCGAGLAPLGGRNRFHQHTGVLVTMEPA